MNIRELANDLILFLIALYIFRKEYIRKKINIKQPTFKILEFPFQLFPKLDLFHKLFLQFLC